MPDEPKKFHLPLAKLYILRENKVPEEDINEIHSLDEANELIAYVQEKNNTAPPADPPTDKKVENGMLSTDGNDFQLPPPGTHDDKLELTVADRLKSARVNNFMNCRWQHARIMRVFGDDEYPEGRVI